MLPPTAQLASQGANLACELAGQGAQISRQLACGFVPRDAPRDLDPPSAFFLADHSHAGSSSLAAAPGKTVRCTPPAAASSARNCASKASTQSRVSVNTFKNAMVSSRC